ncbi:MAG: TonB family protein [Rhodothermales bacterium]|nr:TonB family protein [Rhodothermales bacterium]
MHQSDWFGLISSLALHLLLFILLYFVRTDPLIPEELGFIQVEFGTFSEGRPVQRAPMAVPEQERPTPDPEQPLDERPAPSDPEVSKPVDLPDQEQPSVDEETVSTPETEVEAIKPEDPKEEEKIEEEETPQPRPLRPLGSGAVDGNAGAEIGDQGEGSDEAKTAPYQIEGLNRTPLVTALPLYVEKVNVTIRIRITVSPTGEIIRRVPLLKGNPRLEQSAMEALTRWRFNPLPPNVPQENQIGVITFQFRLE